jgi:hypothetical protein
LYITVATLIQHHDFVHHANYLRIVLFLGHPGEVLHEPPHLSQFVVVWLPWSWKAIVIHKVNTTSYCLKAQPGHAALDDRASIEFVWTPVQSDIWQVLEAHEDQYPNPTQQYLPVQGNPIGSAIRDLGEPRRGLQHVPIGKVGLEFQKTARNGGRYNQVKLVFGTYPR